MYGVGINHNTYNSFGLLNFVNSKEEIEHIEEKVWTEGWENEQLEKRKQWLREKWEQKVQILPENREVHLKHLVPVTYADYYECSSDHWAFICDKEYENHDYPMGFVSQGTGNIIYVVKNFQEWLNLFWEYNKNRTDDFLPVIHGLIPDEDERRDLLECGMEE